MPYSSDEKDKKYQKKYEYEHIVSYNKMKFDKAKETLKKILMIY